MKKVARLVLFFLIVFFIDIALSENLEVLDISGQIIEVKSGQTVTLTEDFSGTVKIYDTIVKLSDGTIFSGSGEFNNVKSSFSGTCSEECSVGDYKNLPKGTVFSYDGGVLNIRDVSGSFELSGKKYDITAVGLNDGGLYFKDGKLKLDSTTPVSFNGVKMQGRVEYDLSAQIYSGEKDSVIQDNDKIVLFNSKGKMTGSELVGKFKITSAHDNRNYEVFGRVNVEYSEVTDGISNIKSAYPEFTIKTRGGYVTDLDKAITLKRTSEDQDFVIKTKIPIFSKDALINLNSLHKSKRIDVAVFDDLNIVDALVGRDIDSTGVIGFGTFDLTVKGHENAYAFKDSNIRARVGGGLTDVIAKFSSTDKPRGDLGSVAILPYGDFERHYGSHLSPNPKDDSLVGFLVSAKLNSERQEKLDTLMKKSGFGYGDVVNIGLSVFQLTGDGKVKTNEMSLKDLTLPESRRGNNFLVAGKTKIVVEKPVEADQVKLLSPEDPLLKAHLSNLESLKKTRSSLNINSEEYKELSKAITNIEAQISEYQQYVPRLEGVLKVNFDSSELDNKKFLEVLRNRKNEINQLSFATNPSSSSFGKSIVRGQDLFLASENYRTIRKDLLSAGISEDDIDSTIQRIVASQRLTMTTDIPSKGVVESSNEIIAFIAAGGIETYNQIKGGLIDITPEQIDYLASIQPEQIQQAKNELSKGISDARSVLSFAQSQGIFSEDQIKQYQISLNSAERQLEAFNRFETQFLPYLKEVNYKQEGVRSYFGPKSISETIRENNIDPNILLNVPAKDLVELGGIMNRQKLGEPVDITVESKALNVLLEKGNMIIDTPYGTRQISGSGTKIKYSNPSSAVSKTLKVLDGERVPMTDEEIKDASTSLGVSSNTLSEIYYRVYNRGETLSRKEKRDFYSGSSKTNFVELTKTASVFKDNYKYITALLNSGGEVGDAALDKLFTERLDQKKSKRELVTQNDVISNSFTVNAEGVSPFRDDIYKDLQTAMLSDSKSK